MASQATRLNATPRQSSGSRANRRLRREGRVPGVLYGGGGEPVAFDVDARALRHALHASGAVLEVALDGETTPAVLKDSQRHPVRGETMHVDLLRVRLDVAIQATVVLDITGADEAPGVKEGGVLEQIMRELNVEALIVGLGNPGSRYDGTPHNVGFEVANALADRWDLPRPAKKFNGLLREGRTAPGGPRVAVLLPQTYMNEAGRSAGPARGAFK